jgi:hypothetical protein
MNKCNKNKKCNITVTLTSVTILRDLKVGTTTHASTIAR